MALIELHSLEEAVMEARREGVDRDAPRLLRWAHGLLGDRLMMTTSFQKGGMVLLHMVRESIPSLPVYFIDTGFHFEETLEFARRIEREWGLRIVFQQPRLPAEAFLETYGMNIHAVAPDFCCRVNKVEPTERILAKHQGWITAIRRDQAPTRAHAQTLEVIDGGKLKVQPLVFWTREQVDAYIQEHRIPIHPLYSRGYPSIGCAPCTRPCADPANERAGRWAGQKVECGLHTFWQGRGGTPVKRTAC
jgi:phosphoadenosine phosphosulfate reductase